MVYSKNKKLEKANTSTKEAPGRKGSKITTFSKCLDTARTSMRELRFMEI